MEHRGVRCVDFVFAVHAAGGQHADGRLLDLLHGADLHRTRLRTKEDGLIIRDIERVAAVAGGVVFCNVQAREIVVGKLDFRPFKDLEAHGDKDLLCFVQCFVHRVAVAKLYGLAGYGDVNGFGGKSGLQRFFLERKACLFQLFFNGGTYIVGRLAHDGALFCGELSHHFQNTGQLSLFPEKTHTQRIKLRSVTGVVQRIQRFLPDLFELLFHKRRSPFSSNYIIA